MLLGIKNVIRVNHMISLITRSATDPTICMYLQIELDVTRISIIYIQF